MPNIERLQQALRLLDEIPDDRFHMRAVTEDCECGTAHCLAGWMAVDSWFRQNTNVNEIIPADWHRPSWPHIGRNASQLVSDAVYDLSQMLGIDERSGSRLFADGLNRAYGPHAVSKSEVRENLERLIRGEPAKAYAVIRS